MRAATCTGPSSPTYPCITMCCVSEIMSISPYSTSVLLYKILDYPISLWFLVIHAKGEYKRGTSIHKNCQYAMIQESPDIAPNCTPVNFGLAHPASN